MAFCRKICCCDFSEDRNKTLNNNNNDSVEMRNQQAYSPSSNYGRDQRASSLLSNANSDGSNSNNSPRLQDPLMITSPGASSSENVLHHQDNLPMSPLLLNHNASFARKPAGGNLSPTSFAGISPLSQPGSGGGGSGANGKKKSITFAPKGFEQPKHTTTSLQGNGQLKGIYKHKSSYGGESQLDASGNRLVVSSSSATQQALGSPYPGADVTGGREPPDLSLL